MARVMVSNSPIFSALLLETQPDHAIMDSPKFKNHHKDLEVRDVPDASPVSSITPSPVLEGRVVNRPPGRPSPAAMPKKSTLKSKSS